MNRQRSIKQLLISRTAIIAYVIGGACIAMLAWWFWSQRSKGVDSDSLGLGKLWCYVADMTNREPAKPIISPEEDVRAIKLLELILSANGWKYDAMPGHKMEPDVWLSYYETEEDIQRDNSAVIVVRYYRHPRFIAVEDRRPATAHERSFVPYEDTFQQIEKQIDELYDPPPAEQN